MAIQFVLARKKTRSGSTTPRPIIIDLNGPGRLRVGHWLTLLDFTSPTFYRRLKAGTIPAPSGNDGRPYWTTKVVREFLEGPDSGK